MPSDSQTCGRTMNSVNDLFDLHIARSHAYRAYEGGPVAFVSNGLKNNGVVGYVKPKPKDKVFEFDAVCVSAFCEATMQQAPFVARGNGGSGLVILEPKKPMTSEELFWYAAYINESVRWRFSFGRMLTAERLSRIELPEPQRAVIPDVRSLIPKAKLPNTPPREIDLTPVPLTSLFFLKSGDYHKASDLPDGPLPLVSCGNEDNGLVRRCSVPHKHVYRDALTVAYNGAPLTTKYHPYPFAAKDDVAVLLPRQPLNAATLLFVQMMLNRERWRYSYGRKCFREKLSRMSVLLPLTSEGAVDEAAIAEVMENTAYWEFVAKMVRNVGAMLPEEQQAPLFPLESA